MSRQTVSPIEAVGATLTGASSTIVFVGLPLPYLASATVAVLIVVAVTLPAGCNAVKVTVTSLVAPAYSGPRFAQEITPVVVYGAFVVDKLLCVGLAE